MGRPKKIQSEKECPRCRAKHYKRGAFCSRSCANVREHSDLDKINKSLSVQKYYKTDASELHKWKLSNIARAAKQSITDSTIVMPTVDDMEPPLPPDDTNESLRSRVSGRDVWFDVD